MLSWDVLVMINERPLVPERLSANIDKADTASNASVCKEKERRSHVHSLIPSFSHSSIHLHIHTTLQLLYCTLSDSV